MKAFRTLTLPSAITTATGAQAAAIGNIGIYTDVSAVPVPAAVLLFGSGLISLAGLVRRKA